MTDFNFENPTEPPTLSMAPVPVQYPSFGVADASEQFGAFAGQAAAPDEFSGFGRLFTASRKATEVDGVAQGKLNALYDAANKRNADIKATTGEELGNPYLAVPLTGTELDDPYAAPHDKAALAAYAKENPNYTPGQIIDAQGQERIKQLRLSNYQSDLERLHAKYPDQASTIAANKPLIDDARTLTASALAEQAAAKQTAPGVVAPYIAQFAGSLTGAFRDPQQAAALMVAGPELQAVKSLRWGGEILARMIGDGFLNAGIAASSQPEVQQWRAERGQENGVVPALQDVGMNFLFGAAIGGVAGAAHMALKPAAVDLVNRAMAGDMNAAREVAAILPKEHAPDLHAYLEADGHDAAATADRPDTHVSTAELERSYQQAIRHHEDPSEPLPELLPTIDRRHTDTVARDAIEANPDQSPLDVLRADAGAPVGFTTAKGSTYLVHEDGTTTRDKAARTDVGHEGDSGIKPRTERTVYVDGDASVLSAAGLNGLGDKGARVAIKDGRASLLTWNERAGKWGVAPESRNITISETPGVGKSPLELWGKADDVPGYEAYRGQHAGNRIVAIRTRQQHLIESALVSDDPGLQKAGRLASMGDDAFDMVRNGEVDPNVAAEVAARVNQPDEQAAILRQVAQDRGVTPQRAAQAVSEIMDQRALPESLTRLLGADGARFQEVPAIDYSNRSVTARMFADEVRGDLGTDVPGTLVSTFLHNGEEVHGIPAYHGTPHEFDRFDINKIGTGEGAQAYGHGLYFAERRGIAEQYKRNVAYADLERKARDAYDEGTDPRDAEAELFADPTLTPSQRELLDALKADDWLGFDYPHQAIREALKKGAAQRYDLSSRTIAAVDQASHLYTVRIARSPEHFLDWDKPLNEQSEYVRTRMARALGLPDRVEELPNGRFATMSGDQVVGRTEGWPFASAARDALRIMQEDFRKTGALLYESSKLVPGPYRDKATATQRLQEAGIAGIRYADAGSRPVGGGAYMQVLQRQLADAEQELKTSEGRLRNAQDDFRKGDEAFIKAKEQDIEDAKAQIESAKKRIADEEEKIAKPTRNYVVFNDRDIHITHKNDVAVAREQPLPDFLRAEAKAQFTDELKAAGIRSQDFDAELTQRATALLDKGERLDHATALEQAAVERLAEQHPDIWLEARFGDEAQWRSTSESLPDAIYESIFRDQSPNEAAAFGSGAELRGAGETGGLAGPAPAKPQSLLAFLRAAGGIKDYRGELRGREYHRTYPGLINNKKGLPLDRAREAAAEAGYLGHDTERAMAETDVNDLLNALEDAHNTFSAHDGEQLVRWQAHQAALAEAELGVGQGKPRPASGAGTDEPTFEPGAENLPQGVIPGTERIGQGELAQRRADEGLKSSVAQKDTEGLALFGDARNQTDLLDLVRQEEAAPAPERLEFLADLIDACKV